MEVADKREQGRRRRRRAVRVAHGFNGFAAAAFRLSPFVRPAPANHLSRLTQWSHRLDPSLHEAVEASHCTLFFARKEIDSDPILIHVKSYFNRVSTLY